MMSSSATAPEATATGTCTCVVGLQWGDEAKGKLVDPLAEDHDIVVRYNGGANAGHTIVRGGRSFKLSLLPSGVLNPRLTSLIGNGVVIYPPRFIEEVSQLREAGIPVGTNLLLSDRAHVVFPYHMEEERLSETDGGGAIGTTGRGIGPCYQDKVGRTCGIRVGDLLVPEYLRDRLRMIVPRKNRWIEALAAGKEAKKFDADALAQEYLGYGEALRPHVHDTAHFLRKSLQHGKRILFEAAQGSLLDIDHGTYPYVTSSNSSPAGIWSGSGLPARRLTRVLGVVKAYTTRVGRGPFPTELTDGPDGLGEAIRRKGREYGTVTGRPRRVGWLDLVALRYAAEVGGVDELAVTLLDVLSCVPEIAICTAYEVQGERVQEFPADARLLEQAKPVLERLSGWYGEELTQVRRIAELPAAARRYVDRIAEELRRPVRIISVGPDREQTILP
ncbi:MAG: adenylosuccinate synthase [Gemmataceae bacterium]|nr:adenylosuccinate synthase [Gemmataceae bacterium]